MTKDWRDKYEKYQKQMAEISDKVLVPNWFLPEHIEDFMGRELTEKEYQLIILDWQDNGGFDQISTYMREYFEENKAQILVAIQETE